MKCELNKHKHMLLNTQDHNNTENPVVPRKKGSRRKKNCVRRYIFLSWSHHQQQMYKQTNK